MVKEINNFVCGGVAGRRNGNIKGFVIHNDAGSLSAKGYVSWLKSHNLENGFAHVYVDRYTIFQSESFSNMAWHTANSDGNANYIGYEVCESMSASDKDFLANEQVVFKDIAKQMKALGMKPNRNTVRLHKEFVPTACPHRSWDMHGKSVNSVKDYFISQIKKYMNGDVKPMTPKADGYWQRADDGYSLYEVTASHINVYKDNKLNERRRLRLGKGTRFYASEVHFTGGTTRLKMPMGWVSGNTKWLKRIKY